MLKGGYINGSWSVYTHGLQPLFPLRNEHGSAWHTVHSLIGYPAGWDVVWKYLLDWKFKSLKTYREMIGIPVNIAEVPKLNGLPCRENVGFRFSWEYQ